MTQQAQKTYKFWTHSTRCISNNDEGIVVKEKIATPQADGSYTWTDNLRTIVNPKRSFYIHQEKYRNYQYKIEHAPIEQCDRFICYNKELENEIKERQHIYTKRRMSIRELCNSPYLYGADVDIEVLIKISYMKQCDDALIGPKYSFGALDTEVSVVETDGRIMLASYCVDGVVHSIILDDFLYKPGPIGQDGYPKRIKATLADIHEAVPVLIGDYLERFKLTVEYHLVYTELDLIKKLMSLVHASKVDFCGAWNMPYDIPKIIQRIGVNHGCVEDIFCHPDVPRQFRYAKYRPDFSHTDHFTDSWDWFNCTGHTQYIDSMRLFSRLRKVKGREPSYTLGSISQKLIGHGKMDLKGTHWYNQLYNFIAYTAYNIIDSGNVWLMEMKNGDASSMCMLVGNSLLKSFSKQTVMLKNDFYQYCLGINRISGTVGEDMGTPYDDLIGKSGGTVLSPYLIRDAGLRCVTMRRTLATLLYIFIKDIDAASMYPYTTKAFNISKETCLATFVKLNHMKDADIEELFVAMIAPTENAFLYGHKFFNLPTPTDLLTRYTRWFESRGDKSVYEIRNSLGI